jgi:hypothetical protein
MNILVGKTITKIKIAEDKQAILFITEDGEIMAKCDGDCCSYTWVEHMTLPYLGLPCKVLAADDIPMPDLGEMPGCEQVSYYGFKISTDKGDIVIDYRNDSNGYYGGNICWPNDNYFYGGVYGQNISKENWQEINSEF